MSDSPHSANVSRSDFQQQVLDRSSTVPVLVDFWAAWCAPCRSLMPLLAKLADDYAGKFFLAKVDTEAERELAAQYGIRSLPTVKLFKDGKPVDEFMGALPEPNVREFLDRHLPREADALIDRALEAMAAGKQDEALGELRAALEQDPSYLRPRLELACGLMQAGKLGEADETIAAVSITDADNPEIKSLKAQLGIARNVAGAPDREQLEQRIAENPKDTEARMQLAARLVLEKDYANAMDQLLEVVRRDRGYGDDAGRRTLLDVFSLLGDSDPLVKQYRGKLAMALN
jgi:putative thioredoxin